MKKLLIATGLALTTALSSFAAPLGPTGIDASILSSFSGKFLSAENVQWVQRPDYTEAKFTWQNQLMQAFAALTYANKVNKKLRYYINVGRVEGYQAKSILKNIRDLFAKFPEHQLVEVGWLEHKDFIQLVRQMDLGLQLSYSETFNIVTADFVSNYIPVVVGAEIDWIPTVAPDVNDLKMIHVYMEVMLKDKSYTERNAYRLKLYSKESLLQWVRVLNNFYS